MDKTEFAGLTRLDPGDSLATDGYSFQAVNPLITDRLLKLAVRTHRHDAHAPIADPADAPVVTLTANGSLPADADIAIGYTLIDSDGGETRLSPVTLVTTASAMEPPDLTPSYEVDNVGGVLTAGSYTYMMTLTDPYGETTPGPAFVVDVDPGTDTNAIRIIGLSDIVAGAEGATGWRMYKASSVGRFHFLAAGGAALDELFDDGMLCADCGVTPPTVNTTSVSQGIEVTIPDTVVNNATGVVAYRVYASVGGTFLSPSYVEQRDDFGVLIDYQDLVVEAGMPPDVSTSYGGAQKIDPDTELVDWHWKRPVADFAALPEPADPGDVRVTLNDGVPYVYTDEWHPFEAAAVNWKPAVADDGALPPAGNAVGDARVSLATRKIWLWTGAAWLVISSPPHTIINADGVPMPQRGMLQFLNALVEDDALNDRTVVTPEGGGGGGGGPLNVGDLLEWRDGAGVVRGTLGFQGLARYSEWYREEFDAPLSNWGSLDVEAVGGNMQPDASHPLNDDVYPRKGSGSSRQMWLDTQFTFPTLDFNAVGIGALGVDDTGWFLVIAQSPTDELSVELQYRVDGAEPFTNIQATPVDPGALVAGDEVIFSITREGDIMFFEVYNVTQDILLGDGQEIEVPAPILAYNGIPAIRSNIRALGSWQLAHFYADLITTDYQLQAASGSDEKILLTTAPSTTDWAALDSLGADWTADSAQVRLNDSGQLEFRGKLMKTAGTAPLADELIVTVEDPHYLPTTTWIATATGDSDGQDLGMLKFDAGTGTIRWVSGRSSDPATKSPFVVLDNIRL